jgi:cytochrome P450
MALLMNAAVDTTSSLSVWNLIHLAANPEVQERLHAELAQQLPDKDVPLTAAALSSRNLPYLHMVMREAHRVRPSLGMQLRKEIQAETELCGVTVPANSVVVLDACSLQNDPELVPSPLAFRPERWLPEAVAGRVGTPSEVIDHPLLRAPFSAGARMCPGSRVANFEVLSLLVHVVRDWRFTLADKTLTSGLDVPWLQKLTAVPAGPMGFEFEARTQ